MPWNFNYCAPAQPNDSTLQFNRNLQICSLIALLFSYILVHIYYYMFGPQPLEHKQNNSSQNPSPKSMNSQIDESKKQKSLENSSQVQSNNDENDSYLTFRNRKSYKNMGKSLGKSSKSMYKVVENVTIKQIESFFPLIFGHYSIVVAQSTLYTPYFQQSLGIFLYAILSIVLMILNGKRKKIGVRIVWAIMCFLLLFVAVSVLVQIGQTNYGPNQKACFAKIYKSIY